MTQEHHPEAQRPHHHKQAEDALARILHESIDQLACDNRHEDLGQRRPRHGEHHHHDQARLFGPVAESKCQDGAHRFRARFFLQ